MTIMAIPPEKTKYWRVKDVMKHMGFTQRSDVYNLINRGLLPGSFQIGDNNSSWLIPIESIENLPNLLGKSRVNNENYNQ